MSEIINTYLLTDPDVVIPMDRDEFYREQIAEFKKNGKPTRANEVVQILIFSGSKELILQKRSFDKTHNPGLLDKSIGGHVRFGDTPDYTVMVETVQELQTPSIVLRNQDDFDKTRELLDEYTSTIAIIRNEQTKIYQLQKIINGEQVVIANKMHVYFGLYNGSIRPVDREAKGILFYSLPELEKEMKSLPDAFTQDLHVLMNELQPEIAEFVNHL